MSADPNGAEPLLDRLRGRKLLLAASTGGHLAQLDLLGRLIKPHPDSLWVTFDKPQSRSLQDGRRIEFIDYIAPRDWRSAWRGFRQIRSFVRGESFDAAISTGAAIAVSALPTARFSGIDSFFVESVSRYAGPSLSGRLLARVPGIQLRTQHEEWASQRWPFEFSVMDAWAADRLPAPRPVRNVFVTLGTIQPYRFDALVDRLLAILPEDVSVVWQLGATARTDLPGEVHDEVSADQFRDFAARADVTITHAGVGTIMELIDRGRSIVAVPRRKRRTEHVDDHQLQVAGELSTRELAVVADAEELTWADLERATTVVPRTR